MAESKEERDERVSREAVDAFRKLQDDGQKWAEEHREEQDVAHESDEEAAERVNVVRRSMMFGDMPTDPTTGDPQVPVNDQEGATVSVAEADAAEDLNDEDADEGQSLNERARQDSHGLTEEQRADAADSEPASQDDGAPTGKTTAQEKKDEGKKTAKEEVKDEKKSSSKK
jgi:hypothetical protein